MGRPIVRRRARASWVAAAAIVLLAACTATTGIPGGNQGGPGVAPVVSVPPASAIVTEGEPASFTVTAQGTAPLAYQWQRNGTAIAGATGTTYTISQTALSDSGAQLRVVVSNAVGSVTSEAATLTVRTGADGGSCATSTPRTSGTRYYYCDCATGALGGPPDRDCRSGDNRNEGTDPEAPRQSLADAAARFNSMQPGDTVALCRGGVWIGSVSFTNASCTQASPCDFRDYSPSWSRAGTPRPRISSDGTVLAVQGSPARGHYRIWNLDVRNPARGGANGVVLLFDGSFHDIDFCDLRVDGGWLGVYFEPSDTVPNAISLRDSQIYNGQFSGFYGGAPGVTITGNTFEGNGVDTGNGGMLMHSAYLISEIGGGLPSDPSVPATYTFSNNRIVEGAYCDGVMLVVHGVFRNNRLVIENNDISTTSSKPQCYGFQTAGGLAGAEFHGVTFRRNRISTPGQTAVEFSCCADCALSDNLVQRGGLELSTSDCNAGSFRSGAQLVQNNTLYESGLTIGSVGTGPYDLDNNVVWRSDAGACYSTQQLGRDDRNYCRAGSGATATAVFVDPARGNFRPAPDGPLVGAGSSTHYSPAAIGSTAWSASDAGATRTPPIDAGAFVH